RRAGRLAFPGYRAMSPGLALVGRPAARYPGIEPYEDFLLMVGDVWPQADLVLLPPFLRCFENRRQGPVNERVTEEIRDLAGASAPATSTPRRCSAATARCAAPPATT